MAQIATLFSKIPKSPNLCIIWYYRTLCKSAANQNQTKTRGFPLAIQGAEKPRGGISWGDPRGHLDEIFVIRALQRHQIIRMGQFVEVIMI